MRSQITLPTLHAQTQLLALLHHHDIALQDLRRQLYALECEVERIKNMVLGRGRGRVAGDGWAAAGAWWRGVVLGLRERERERMEGRERARGVRCEVEEEEEEEEGMEGMEEEGWEGEEEVEVEGLWSEDEDEEEEDDDEDDEEDNEDDEEDDSSEEDHTWFQRTIAAQAAQQTLREQEWRDQEARELAEEMDEERKKEQDRQLAEAEKMVEKEKVEKKDKGKEKAVEQKEEKLWDLKWHPPPSPPRIHLVGSFYWR